MRVPDNPTPPQNLGGGRNASGASIGPALQGLGNTLQSVGGELHKRFVKLEEGKINAQLMKDEATLEMADQESINWTLENQNSTGEFINVLNRNFDTVSSQWSAEESSPELTRRRGLLLAKKQGAAQVRMAARKAMLETQQVKQTYLNTAQRYENAGETDKAAQVYYEAAQAGYMSEASAEKAVIEMQYRGRITNYLGVETEDIPDALTRLEKDKSISGYDRQRIKKSLDGRLNQEKGMAMDELEIKDQAHPGGFMPEAQFERLLEGTGLFSEDEQKAYMNGRRMAGKGEAIGGDQAMEIRRDMIYLEDVYHTSPGDYQDAFNEMRNKLRQEFAPQRNPELWRMFQSLAPDRMEVGTAREYLQRQNQTAAQLKEAADLFARADGRVLWARHVLTPMMAKHGDDLQKALRVEEGATSEMLAGLKVKFQDELRNLVYDYPGQVPPPDVITRKVSDWKAENIMGSAAVERAQSTIESDVSELRTKRQETEKQIRETKEVLPPWADSEVDTSMNLPAPLAPLAASFQSSGGQHGVNPRFLAAISIHETGSGTSRAFKHGNNAMGISTSKGPKYGYSDPSETVEHMAKVLASPRGPYRNARTLGEIAAVYAPVGAGNDQRGLNKHWVEGVARQMKRLGVQDPYNEPLILR